MICEGFDWSHCWVLNGKSYVYRCIVHRKLGRKWSSFIWMGKSLNKKAWVKNIIFSFLFCCIFFICTYYAIPIIFSLPFLNQIKQIPYVYFLSITFNYRIAYCEKVTPIGDIGLVWSYIELDTLVWRSINRDRSKLIWFSFIRFIRFGWFSCIGSIQAKPNKSEVKNNLNPIFY